MSVRTEVRDAAASVTRGDSYDKMLKFVHWATLLLITAAFAAVWASHVATRREQSAMLLELHRSLGITILVLTVFRLACRWHAQIPALPADLPEFQILAARTTEYCLYIALLLQPILGILHTNARGRRLNFYGFGELPAIISPDTLLAKQAMAAHELVANALLTLIGLHAAAALFHHYVRQDNVLRAMLPHRH